MSAWLRERWRSALVVAVAVVMTAGLITTNTLAQTPAATPSAPADEAHAPLVSSSDFFARLAAKLGLSADQVQNAAKEAQTEMIDEAVQAGRVPQERADKLKERVNAGGLIVGQGMGKPHGHGAFGPPMLGVEQRELAGWLGVSVEQFNTELRGGKSLAQVAEAHGKTRDELITFLTDQVKSRLAQAVTNGRLTQEQADARLARFQQEVGQMVDRVPPAGKPGGPHGPRGPRAPEGAPAPDTNA